MTELKILAITILFGGAAAGKEIWDEGRMEKSKVIDNKEKV